MICSRASLVSALGTSLARRDAAAPADARTERLKGGTIYYDGQFDDARLAICLAQTAADSGAVLINYMPVVSLVKKNDLVRGVAVKDLESGQEHELNARVVVNATGVFSDSVRQWTRRMRNRCSLPARAFTWFSTSPFCPRERRHGAEDR